MSDLHDLLEAIRTRYAYAARMANDLRVRLDAIEGERVHWEAAADNPDVEARARLELREIDHLRPRMERSARSWGDRARALELVVAAALVEAPRRPIAPQPALAPDVDQRPLLPEAAWPSQDVRDLGSAGHL